ncbi:MAG: hypothetical protein H5T49_00590 [Hadesarchaea archaeon]|nr:hypothetical protein [Hadesarchaea archaeon]
MNSSEIKKHLKRAFGRRNPWLAAFLNFFIWGAGFVYAGRRLFLGVSLLLFTMIISLSAGLAQYDFYQAAALALAAWLLISLALAREAYFEARERNRKGGGKGEDDAAGG